MSELFADSNKLWLLAFGVLNFFTPLLLLSLIISFVFSTVPLAKGIASRDWKAVEVSLGHLQFIFSFCVVGIALGMIIRLLGGFSLGAGDDGDASQDIFQFLGTMISVFSAVVALFFGEAQVKSGGAIRPIGTAAAILLMMFSYVYFSLVLLPT